MMLFIIRLATWMWKEAVRLGGWKGDLITRSYNTEDYVLDTLAQYPGDPTLGKLTFMVSLKTGWQIRR